MDIYKKIKNVQTQKKCQTINSKKNHLFYKFFFITIKGYKLNFVKKDLFFFKFIFYIY